MVGKRALGTEISIKTGTADVAAFGTFECHSSVTRHRFNAAGRFGSSNLLTHLLRKIAFNDRRDRVGNKRA